MLRVKFAELWDELRTIVLGRKNWLDILLPPIVYLITNALLSPNVAILITLSIALFLSVIRLRRRQSMLYALGGLGAVVIALLAARLFGSVGGYFLPSILSATGTVLLAVISIAIGKPLVAWTSFLARRWPLGWYWHPKIRPAYNEVTGLWVIYFSLRALLQWGILQGEGTEAFAALNLLLGWPATIILLLLSYIYGTWRLRNLGGPSVEEFREGAQPPWESQRRGF
jgi:hypothetical protein